MLTVTHSFNCALADDPKAAANGEILVSHWNSNHAVSGVVDSSVGARTRLTAATTYHVSTVGSDSNDGLTIATAWATLQHAYNYLSQNIDFAGFIVNVQMENGTYAGFSLNGTMVGTGLDPNNLALSDINVLGNAGNASLVTISSAVTLNKADFTQSIRFFNLTSNVSGKGTPAFDIESSGQMFLDSVTLAGIDSSQFYLRAFGPQGTFLFGTLTLSGGSAQGLMSINDACFAGTFGGTITITGTPAWGTGFVDCNFISDIEIGGSTFSGSATGKRFNASCNSSIITGGKGVNFLPGNTAGTVSNGASYS